MVEASKMEDRTCFECLQRRIQTDFSDKLIFCYGISDSALPFGSRAVVQLTNSTGEVSAQFVCVCVPRHEDDCLAKYVDEYSLENMEDNIHGKGDTASSKAGQDQAKIIDGFFSGETISLDSVRNMSQCSLNCGSRIALGGVESDGSRVTYSERYSYLRTITALAPVAYVGIGCYSVVEELACNFLSGSMEDHILASLNLLVEGKPTGRDGVNFLSVVGMPSFGENNIPGCVRHPNIAPVLGMLKTPHYINLLLPKHPYTLEDILHYSPDVLKTEWHIMFLIYQILSAIAYIHGLGVAHGDICPSSVMVTNSCWSWLSMCDNPWLRGSLSLRSKEQHPQILSSRLDFCFEDCPCQALYADMKLSPTIDWFSDNFKRWWVGDLSNYDYLLILNRLAGRRWGDHTFHTVMPWVIDFSVKPNENSDTGWRDLRKSKWRLAKGDEQLDFTYSTSEIPHHISDECLSELAVCSYKARRLPLSILRMAVRSVYEPNEYPSNMQRLYQWTPDECIPEFYTDPRIFASLHLGMSDLAVPTWANSPEEFIKLHRDALESSRVSRQIHHWIDITFGYKMSGQAAVAAKNVMLRSSEPTLPRSIGRRQLFTRPHPVRRGPAPNPRDSSEEWAALKSQTNEIEINKPILSETAYLQELEEAALFCEHARHLSPLYHYRQLDLVKNVSSVKESQYEHLSKTPGSGSDFVEASDIDLSSLLEYLEVDDGGLMGFQELLLWKQKSSSMGPRSEDVAEDIFSVGCILAELYLKRPLFNSTSLTTYMESGVLPPLMQELPPHAAVLIEACIQRDWWRRPSSKCLLESPYFPMTVRSAYLFSAPLHLLAKDGSRFQYAAKFAKHGALKAMGTFAAEMCAPYCLSLLVTPLSDADAEWGFLLLKEFLHCLKPQALKTLIFPTIQKILQATDYSHLKVSLLQDSFVREVWKRLGEQAYLETIHPLVISNLHVSPHKNSASAASVLLIGSSEELGVPVTVHQTILPLIHCFGKGLCADGIDVLVRIGGLLGENFVVRQLLPLLRNVVLSCIDFSNVDKPEPMQSWNSLALIDSLMTLDGLVAVLPRELVIKELIQEQRCLHVKVLIQTHLDLPVLQVAATALVAVCQRIGPDFTALHVLPQLKELFDELAFSQEITNESGSFGRSIKVSKPKLNEDAQIESRMDLALLLYPSFASLLGIEKLRQCCATWLLLEQFLQRSHNWKWEYTGEASRGGSENVNAQRQVFSKISTSEYNPAKLLLNGVGWSIPQSQGVRGSKNLVAYKQSDDLQQTPAIRQSLTSNHGKREPWFWFPSPAASWDGPDFLGRIGGLKDELPWKIRASIIYSVRSHPGALRSLAVCHNECTVFTGGVGPGFKGTVQKWELARVDRVSGYYGHEEVVNDICILSSSGRVASCDGTIHLWNSQTGKLISAYAEPSANSSQLVNSLSSASRMSTDQANMLNSNTLSGGILTGAFGGSMYTCMHYLESSEKLVTGTGNGSLRFIDVAQDQKLHLWRSESVESPFSSLVSAICSCGSDKMQADRTSASSSWIAAGLSSGHCRLLDARSGSVIAFWQAHGGYITKLAAPEDHLLVSSSLDKTLRVWDLRRNWPSQSNVFSGHSDGVSGFSVWGQDVISISRNKIGLSSLSRSGDEGGHQRILAQKLYMADRGTRNLSVLSSISILPFSRLFLVGTEDGYLKICC